MSIGSRLAIFDNVADKSDVNLFVDHSQIVQLECLRAGIWGTKSLWGRVLTYKG
jgi:phosphosulfolactate synthase (CoM biosynthesis protein A)